MTAADTSIPAVIRNFYYDGSDPYQEVGKLHLERSSDGFRRAYYYDDLGRSFLTLSKIDGRWFYEQTQFDDYSRPTRLTHYWRPPSIDDRSGTNYLAWYSYPQFTEYNERGYVQRIYDNYGLDWWKSPEYNAQGQLTSYVSGNELETVTSYDARNHRVDTIQVLADTQQLLSYDYDFDPLGNLESREDLISGQLEELVYDRMNRLRTSTIDGTVATVNYDDFGNITSRTGVGAYTYLPGSCKVSTAGGRSFTGYNANGAITAISGGSTGTIQWNAFNKLHQIEMDDSRSNFGYDSNGFRVWQTRSKYEGSPAAWAEKTRKTYVGPLFEQEESKTDGTWDITMTRIYVATPAGVIGSWVDRAERSPKRTFFHRDHLGSVIAESNEVEPGAQYGALARRMSFAAWGNYRDPANWKGSAAVTDEAQSLSTDRGFTGHEMLNALGIIHMNGRIYDPGLGRFLSPDPIIQAPGNLQNYNRYSYVLNSPLSNTDPSGFVTTGNLAQAATLAAEMIPKSSGQEVQSDALSGKPTETATANTSVESVDQSNKGDAGGLSDISTQIRASDLKTLFSDEEIAFFNENGYFYTGPHVWINNDYGANLIAEFGAEFTPIGFFTAGKDVFDNPANKLAWLGLAPLIPRAGALDDLPKGKGSPSAFATNRGVGWKNGWRTADGKFASPNGAGRSGAAAEQSVWDAVSQKPGWNVIEGNVGVRNASGQLRYYDGAAVSPRGRVIGLEVKSGSAVKTPAQRIFDSGVNTSNPAVGVGQNRGLEVGRSLQIRR